MTIRFNPPPGWPVPAADFVPDDAWHPDPSWPPAPAGWQFWVEQDVAPAGVPAAAPRIDPAAALGLTGLVIIALLGLLSGGFSSAAILVGLFGMILAIVGCVHGHVRWARLRTRGRSAAALAVATGLVLVGAVGAGSAQPTGVPPSSALTEPSITTSPVAVTSAPTTTTATPPPPSTSSADTPSSSNQPESVPTASPQTGVQPQAPVPTVKASTAVPRPLPSSVAPPPSPKPPTTVAAPMPPPPGATSGPQPGNGYACPPGLPIKGNASSMIAHKPGDQSYEKTKPEQCFATMTAAVAAGYRPAKR